MTTTIKRDGHAAIAIDEALARQTTKRLVARTEGFLILAQAFWIVATSYVDKVTPEGQYILYGAAGLHLVAAVAAVYRGGPFIRGGLWMVLWVGAAVLMPIVIASLVPARDYGSSPACVQLCGYPVPPIMFFAFYPWIGVDRDHLRPALNVAAVATFILEPLAIIVLTHDYLTADNWTSWAVSSLMYLVAFGFGWSLGLICREATTAQDQARKDTRKDLYNDLHDEIEPKTLAAREHFSQGRHKQAFEVIDALSRYIRAKRAGLLAQEEDVLLASVIEEQVAQYYLAIQELQVAGSGPLTVSQSVERLVAQGLGAMLKNVSMHAQARRVEVNNWLDRGFVVVEVIDDGVGFPARFLATPGKNLCLLRERARQLDGELRKVETGQGSRLQLWVPLHRIE